VRRNARHWRGKISRLPSTLSVGTPWILDLDATVKCLYGNQEGALVGYNPKKPGRPSHCYHNALMANTRLVLAMAVTAGNETAPLHSRPEIWDWLDVLPKAQHPPLLRGDIAYCNESVMREANVRDQPYLTKLRLTKNVKVLIKKLFRANEWENLEDKLTLSGWSRERRVAVLRRKLTGEILLNGRDELQNEFAFIEGDVPTARYEYAVLVTSTAYPIRRAEKSMAMGWFHDAGFGTLPTHGTHGRPRL